MSEFSYTYRDNVLRVCAPKDMVLEFEGVWAESIIQRIMAYQRAGCDLAAFYWGLYAASGACGDSALRLRRKEPQAANDV